MEKKWYIVYNGQQTGPMDIKYGLGLDSSVWCQGMADWSPAGTVPELVDLIGQSPVGSVPPPVKSKIVAGILALFLGAIGLQYF